MHLVHCKTGRKGKSKNFQSFSTFLQSNIIRDVQTSIYFSQDWEIMESRDQWFQTWLYNNELRIMMRNKMYCKTNPTHYSVLYGVQLYLTQNSGMTVGDIINQAKATVVLPVVYFLRTLHWQSWLLYSRNSDHDRCNLDLKSDQWT